MDTLCIEIVQLIANNLPDKDLGKLTTTNKTMYSYCIDILNERKWIDTIGDHLSNDELTNIIKTDNNNTSKFKKLLKYRIENNIILEKDYIVLGITTFEKWFKGGVIHRDDDKPAIIYYDFLKKRSEHWFQNNKFHRTGDKATIIYYFYNGNKAHEIWYQYDELYREYNEATSVIYNFDGTIKSKIWMHKTIDLAYAPILNFYYDSNRNKIKEVYTIHGESVETNFSY